MSSEKPLDPCPLCKAPLNSRDGYYACPNRACSFPLGIAPGEAAAPGPADVRSRAKLDTWELKRAGWKTEHPKGRLGAYAAVWISPDGRRMGFAEARKHLVPPALIEAENVCEHGDHSAPAGKRFCSDACERCEHESNEETGCDGICRPAPQSPQAAPSDLREAAVWAAQVLADLGSLVAWGDHPNAQKTVRVRTLNRAAEAGEKLRASLSPRPATGANPCGTCGGSRKVDSGGQDGAGNWIDRDCPECTPGADQGGATATDKESAP